MFGNQSLAKAVGNAFGLQGLGLNCKVGGSGIDVDALIVSL